MSISPEPEVEARMWTAVKNLREKAPLVQCLTNFVSMDIMANGLLAIGASPAMVHSTHELGNAIPIVAAINGAVSINIGTLDDRWIESFKAAVELCKQNDVPWVLDPVAAGFTPLRTNTALELMAISAPTVLRGNGSEIMALAPAADASEGGGKGVDSTEGSDAAVDAAKRIVAKYGCVVVVTGAIDYIVSADADGKTTIASCPHGVEMLTKVTAAGCLVSSVVAAFVASRDKETSSVAEAAAMAMTWYGICGELAMAESKGPGSFRANFLDRLYNTKDAASSGVTVKTTLA